MPLCCFYVYMLSCMHGEDNSTRHGCFLRNVHTKVFLTFHVVFVVPSNFLYF